MRKIIIKESDGTVQFEMALQLLKVFEIHYVIEVRD